MDPVSELLTLSSTELADEASALRALEAAEGAPAPPALKPVHDRLPEKGTTIGLHVYWSRALREAGQEEDADQVLLAVAERLNQAGYWTALVRLIAPLLDRHAHTVAPLLARARIQGGASAVSDPLLEEAHAALPHHGRLAWLVAEARLAAGDEGGARRAASAALKELAEEKDYDTAEMAILLLAEDPGPAAVRSLIGALETFGKQEAWAPLATLVEVAGDAMAEQGARQAWPIVRDLWGRHPGNEDLRALATRVVKHVFTDYPEPAALVRISEIERPSQPAPVVLERLAKALRFPPGYYARHSGWGIGRILDNDTESLVIDFPGKPSHRMSIQTAGNALDVLPPDDLRVLAAVQPEEPARLAKEDPAGLLHLALRAFPDGEATGEALRKFLVPASIPSAQWSAWWKRAREAAAGDARIDTRRAYDNLFRRADGTEAEEDTVPLPDWPEGADPVPLLPVFSTFLEHHPGRAAALREAFVPRLRELVLAARTAPAPRVACFLWLAARGEEVDLDLDSRVDLGFPMSTLSKAEQEQLLERLDAASSLAAALGSRWVSIRRSAWARLQERNETTAAARLVLERGRDLPEAGLHLLEAAGSDPSLTGEADLPPRLLACLLDLLERPPRETHRKRAMALLAPGSPLETAVRNASWTEDDIARLVTRLKEWQGSDRHRFPALEFLERAGLSQIAEDVEGHRARAAARLSRRVVEGDEEDPYAGFHLLTRPSFEKLQAERMRVGMELKTTIPQAIQRARELGDLRENAEYDAAKAKQATYAKRFEELDTLCRQSRFIEELDRTPDTVLPGTEVVLDPLGEGEAMSLWILGEGDQELGKDVVSYKAPIGQALLQKRVGDEVRLPRDGEEFPARIRTVRERLP